MNLEANYKGMLHILVFVVLFAKLHLIDWKLRILEKRFINK